MIFVAEACVCKNMFILFTQLNPFHTMQSSNSRIRQNNIFYIIIVITNPCIQSQKPKNSYLVGCPYIHPLQNLLNVDCVLGDKCYSLTSNGHSGAVLCSAVVISLYSLLCGTTNTSCTDTCAHQASYNEQHSTIQFIRAS